MSFVQNNHVPEDSTVDVSLGDDLDDWEYLTASFDADSVSPFPVIDSVATPFTDSIAQTSTVTNTFHTSPSYFEQSDPSRSTNLDVPTPVAFDPTMLSIALWYPVSITSLHSTLLGQYEAPSSPLQGWGFNITGITRRNTCVQHGLGDSTTTERAQETNSCEPRPLPIFESITGNLFQGQNVKCDAQANTVECGAKSSTSKAKRDSGEKTFKPMRMYNHYFRDERDNFLKGLAKKGDPLPPPVCDFSQEKMSQLLHRHWYIDPTKGQRVHRKTHGKIEFLRLSQVIASRWRDLPASGREFYRQVAQADQAHHNKMSKQRIVS